MESNSDVSTSTPPRPKRSPLKTQSHNYSLWKDKLRQNCYRRVREERSRLLWKIRLPDANYPNNKEYIKSAFQDIVSDELKKIKHPSTDLQSKSLYVQAADDMLWDYDGLHDAYQVECEDILLEMQRIFYEDLSAEPAQNGPENYIETWEDKEDEYLAQAVFEHMQLNDKQMHKKTWCPICKQGELQEDNKIIHCTHCELKLSKGNEINLDILQTRLAEAHEEHLDRGCRMKPKFCVETRYGLTALYIFCKDCEIFESLKGNCIHQGKVASKASPHLVVQ